MFGTVSYFSEKLMSFVMNRLVAKDDFSLEQHYEKIKREVFELNESNQNIMMYQNNLDKAYEKITDSIYGVEEEAELI